MAADVEIASERELFGAFNEVRDSACLRRRRIG